MTLQYKEIPQGFEPKRLIKAKNVLSLSASHATQDSHSADVAIPIDEQILIAEIGGGGRWKQINFPVNIFEKFFGAQRGDNTYRIKLTNVALDGSLGEPEERPAVSVASKNYRFEINCAETNEVYSTGENRPIGIFVKRADREFLYQILLPKYSVYNNIKNYLYKETKNNSRELKRAIVHVEAIHALYPELIV